jgi:DNA primase
MNYLKDRGINNEALGIFSVGYAPNSWDALLTHITRKGYKPEAIKKAGLITQGSKGYYDIFRNRIIFPIYDLKGDVVAFGGRAIDGSEPKYLNSPETPIFNKRRILYGLNHAKDSIKKAGYVLFMEGYLDVITAHIFGFSNSVAPLGTAFTQDHGKLIKRFTEDIVLVFDSDEAGIKAAKNAAGILLESGLNVKVLSFPDGEDPDSFLRKKGKEAFSRLLEDPLSIIDFFMLQKGDKRLISREAIDTIYKISDKVLQGYYVKMLSEKLKINEFFIIEALKKKSLQSGSVYRKKAANKPQIKKIRSPMDEVYIIRLLLQLTEKAEEICNILLAEDFKDPTTRALFNKIKGGFLDFNDLLLRCEGAEKALLTEISFTDDFEDPEKVLIDCMKRIKDNRKKILLQQLQSKIKEAEHKKDMNRLKKLQAEFLNLKTS